VAASALFAAGTAYQEWNVRPAECPGVPQPLLEFLQMIHVAVRVVAVAQEISCRIRRISNSSSSAMMFFSAQEIDGRRENRRGQPSSPFTARI